MKKTHIPNYLFNLLQTCGKTDNLLRKHKYFAGKNIKCRSMMKKKLTKKEPVHWKKIFENDDCKNKMSNQNYFSHLHKLGQFQPNIASYPKFDMCDKMRCNKTSIYQYRQTIVQTRRYFQSM